MKLPNLPRPLIFDRSLNRLNGRVPAFVKKQRLLKLLKKSLPYLVGLLLITALALTIAIYSRPRLAVTSLSREILPQLEKTISSLNQVEKNLKGLHGFISGQGISYRQDLEPLLKTPAFATLLQGVLGASTPPVKVSPPYLLIREGSLILKNLARQLKERKDFGPATEIPQSPESPQVLGQVEEENPFRHQLLLSQTLQAAVEEAGGNLSGLKVVLSRNPTPPPLRSLIAMLTQAQGETEKYLSEVKKTADYYILISTVQQEVSQNLTFFLTTVETLSQSERPYLYLKEMEGLKNDFDDSRSKIAAVNEANLPFGLLALHEDNLKILKDLVEAAESITLSIKNNDDQLLKRTMDSLSRSMEETAAAAAELETGFWENNQTLMSWPRLKKDYESTASQLKELYQRNRLPFQPRHP